MKGITSSSVLIITAFVALWLTTSLLYAHHSQWRKLGELHEGRYYFGAAYIGNGEVLVAGGLVKSNSSPGTSFQDRITPSNSCEIIHISNNTVTHTGSLLVARAEFPMLLTKDSDVVAIGGVIKNPYNVTQSRNTPTVEIFRRKTRQWEVLGSLLIARRQHAAIFINDEEILVVAGRMDNLDGTRSAEVFNIRTHTSRRVADYPYPMNNLSLFKTSTGKITAIGGREGGPTSTRYNEVYEYNTEYNFWTISQSLRHNNIPRYSNVYGISHVPLRDGRTLLCGGSESEEIGNSLSRKEIWMESNDTIAYWASLQQGRYDQGGRFAAQLGQNTVLLCGGFSSSGEILQSTEVINIQNKIVTSTTPLIEPHAYTKVLSIPTRRETGTTFIKGSVLCIAGMSFIKHDIRGNLDTAYITPTIEIFEDPDCKEESLFSDFTNGNLYGSAQIGLSPTARDTVLVLSPNMPSTSAAFFSRERAPLYDGFRASFSFMIENGSDNNVPDSSFPGGDGLAFVIHNSRTPIDISNAPGRGLGYTGIPNSLAVEFDMYRNTNFKDPDGNHIAVQCHGRKNNSAKHSKESTLGYSSDIPLFKSDVIYYASVLYKDHRIEVYLETQPITQSTTPRLVVENMDLESLLDLDQGSAYVGFTASTGSASQKQTLLQWNFAPCYIDWNAPKE